MLGYLILLHAISWFWWCCIFAKYPGLNSCDLTVYIAIGSLGLIKGQFFLSAFHSTCGVPLSKHCQMCYLLPTSNTNMTWPVKFVSLRDIQMNARMKLVAFLLLLPPLSLDSTVGLTDCQSLCCSSLLIYCQFLQIIYLFSVNEHDSCVLKIAAIAKDSVHNCDHSTVVRLLKVLLHQLTRTYVFSSVSTDVRGVFVGAATSLPINSRLSTFNTAWMTGCCSAFCVFDFMEKRKCLVFTVDITWVVSLSN